VFRRRTQKFSQFTGIFGTRIGNVPKRLGMVISTGLAAVTAVGMGVGMGTVGFMAVEANPSGTPHPLQMKLHLPWAI